MSKTICFPFLGSNIGGSHLSTLAIIDTLDKARYRPVLVLHDEEGPLVDLINSKNLSYEVLALPWMPQGLKDYLPAQWSDRARAIDAVSDFIRKHNIDAIHLDNIVLRYVWLPAARRTSCKYIHFQRTPLPRFSFEKALSYSLMDLVLANSRHTKQTMPFTVKDHTHVLYPPLLVDGDPPDKEESRADLLKKYGLSAETKIFGFLANLQMRKRPEIIPQIAKQLFAKGQKNFVFLMAGAKYDSSADRTFALIKENRLEDYVSYIGFVDDPLAFLAACDALIAPAVDEAFGRTLIEAMYVGTPVIASDLHGHKEIIEDGKNGTLVPADNVNAFASAVLEIISNVKIYEDITARAQRDVVEAYDAVKHTNDLMDIYDGLFK